MLCYIYIVYIYIYVYICICAAAGDQVAEDEVVGEIETDKVGLHCLLLSVVF